MKLRHQLFIVSLLLLSLPWAGCQYLKAIDIALKDMQATALQTNAQAIAERLAANPTLFIETAHRSDNNSFPLYARRLMSQPIIDGYQDDWRSYQVETYRVEGEHSAVLKVAEFQESIYFFIEVKDDQLSYYNPANGADLSADHVLLTLYSEQSADREIYLYTSAPGNILARYRDKNNRVRNVNAIKGVWRESQQGYHLELAVDKSLLKHGFNLDVIDYRNATEYRLLLNEVLSKQTFYDQIKLVSPSSALESMLKNLNLSDISSYIVDVDRYILASSKAANNTVLPRETHWLIEWFYRNSLRLDSMPSRSDLISHSRWNFPDTKAIDASGAGIFWYKLTGRSLRYQAAVAVAVPLRQNNSVSAYLVLEKNTDQLTALTNSAFNRLLIYSLGVFLLLALGLIAYASWLSWRISRLNRIASTVVTNNGLIEINKRKWPELQAGDELGDLSRSYHKLLLSVRENQAYLRDLSNKLSHELRTPIAIVRSSLDNLADIEDPSQQQQYKSRARQGIERLSHILNAMSTANRIEESLSGAEFKEVKLKDFLQSLTDMYKDVYSEHTIQFVSTVNSLSLPLAQELFVQMMDKLIDNAVGFSPAAEPIIVRVVNEGDSIAIQVENTGPLLPATMQGRLFDSMVSVRTEKTEPGRVHLGLGLYIVRIIAELHGGHVVAQNREDGAGVIFSVRLRA